MDPYDPNATAEERELLKLINESQNYGATGSTVGGAIGGGLGLLAGALTGGAALPVTPVLMGIGSGLGGLIGGGIGNPQAEQAAERLRKLQEERNKPILEKQARDQAFQRLLGRYNKYGV
jgi:hypothetical protein